MSNHPDPRPNRCRSPEPSLRPVLITAADRRLRATVTGPCDRHTGAELRRSLESAGLAQCEALEVDLRSADFLDSDGVRCLQFLAETLTRRSAGFRVLVRAGGRADRTILLLDLGRALHVRRDGAAASPSGDGPIPIS